jgi:phage shock protein A
MKKDFSTIQLQIQHIIDLIAQKNSIEANKKIIETHENLDELIDFSEEGDDLTELSRFQVLLNHLHQKNEVLKSSLN